jgi:hypothetical protein
LETESLVTCYPARDHDHEHDFVSSAKAYMNPMITQATTAFINSSRIYFGFVVGVGEVGCGGMDRMNVGVYKVCTECELEDAASDIRQACASS